jgi:hypothetical protein
VRQLKEKGIEVYFEKENISTLDSRGELLISLLSSLAQTESFQLSKNITWGKRKRCADGIVNLPYKRFLGYEKGPDGTPKIVEKEAKTARLIYQLFLEGKTPVAIAKQLTRNGIPTPGHKTNWRHQTVQSILANEKYKGDALLQKTVTVDFLTKAKKKNEGEAPQYYVENSHAPIISKDMFDIVQYELKRRKNSGMRTRCNERFSSKIICGTCGSVCWRSVWYTKEKRREIIWICSKKAQKASACHSPFVPEEVVEQAFLFTMNDIYQNKADIISEHNSIHQRLCDVTTMDLEITRLKNELDTCRRKLKNSSEKGHGQYPTVRTKYEILQKQLSNEYEKRNERLARSYCIQIFLGQLKSMKQPMTEFDAGLWNTLVDSTIVRSEDTISIVYKCGLQMDVHFSSTDVLQMQAYRSDTAYGANAAD